VTAFSCILQLRATQVCCSLHPARHFLGFHGRSQNNFGLQFFPMEQNQSCQAETNFARKHTEVNPNPCGTNMFFFSASTTLEVKKQLHFHQSLHTFSCSAKANMHLRFECQGLPVPARPAFNQKANGLLRSATCQTPLCHLPCPV